MNGKYRVWDLERKMYINPEQCLIDGDGRFFYKDNVNGQLYDWTEDFVIEFGIGHTDKHGKPIFKGDIVSFTYSNGSYDEYVIIWNHSAWGFGSKGGFKYPLKDIEQYERVGNIHENPEKIKGTYYSDFVVKKMV